MFPAVTKAGLYLMTVPEEHHFQGIAGSGGEMDRHSDLPLFEEVEQRLDGEHFAHHEEHEQGRARCRDFPVEGFQQ
jgi:hypothetical protein